MKKLTLLFAAPILVGGFTLAGAATYYVDAVNGNDGNTGTSTGQAWLRLQKAADTMASGDKVFVRAGTYRETVTPKSGQTFEAYQNEKPLISGYDPVSGWKVHSGSIYKATVNTKVLDVFVGPDYMQKARYPNEDGDPLTTSDWASATTSVVSGNTGKVVFQNGMNRSSNYWVDGWYSGVHGTFPFLPNEGRISASSGAELTCSDMKEAGWAWMDPAWGGSGRGYITDHLNCLDAEKEWHWQSNTLYFRAPGSGVPTNVEARTRIFGFVLNNSKSVVLKGLYFKGASVHINGGSYCTMDACHFRHVSPWGIDKPAARWFNYGTVTDGTSGIDISGSNHAIKNSSVVGGWGSGIRLGGEELTVENNYLENIGWNARWLSAPISGYGTHLYIKNNTIKRTNTAGIVLVQKNPGDNSNVNHVRYPFIMHNDIRDVNYLLADGGAFIYINNDDVPDADRWLRGEISYNFCTGNRSRFDNTRGITGIYIDAGSDFVTIHHNVLNLENPTTGCGLLINGAEHLVEDVFVYHNTLWGYKGNAIEECDYFAGGGVSNVVFRNNHAQQGPYKRACAGSLGGNLTIDHNRTDVPASEFVNVANSDFRLNGNASTSKNTGVVIPGINDAGSESPYVGSAPDLGAYEYGGTNWTAGSTVTPPGFPDECSETQAPAAPGSIQATASGYDRITLTWIDNATTESGFRIERKSVGGSYTQIGSTGSNTTGFVNSGLVSSSSYTYRIVAWNCVGASAYSNEATAVTAAGPARELKVHWKFDETTGSTAADATGNGNTGTLHNMENSDWTSGKSGNALLFDGIDEYVDNSSLGSAFDGDASVVLWVKTTSTRSGERIADLAGSGAMGLQITLTAGGTIALDNDGGPAGTSATTAINDGAWHLIAAVRSGSDYSLFVDGGAAEGICGGTAPAYSRLFVGMRSDGVDYTHFTGSIDDVRLYNYPLTQAAVDSLYRGGAVIAVDRMRYAPAAAQPVLDLYSLTGRRIAGVPGGAPDLAGHGMKPGARALGTGVYLVRRSHDRSTLSRVVVVGR